MIEPTYEVVNTSKPEEPVAYFRERLSSSKEEK